MKETDWREMYGLVGLIIGGFTNNWLPLIIIVVTSVLVNKGNK